MMKTTKLLAATVSLLSVSALAHAADNNTPPPAPDNHSIVTAIQQLGNQMESLTKAGVRSVNELAYKLDQSFSMSMALNIKQSDIQNDTRTRTQLESSQAIKRALQPFAAATLTYTNKSQPEVQKVNQETSDNQDNIQRLQNVDASDSIYSLVQGMELSSYWTKKNLGIPGRNDDAFNFAALIEPEAYTPEQAINSANFIGYATRQYQSYADGLNLSALRNALMQYQKQGVKTLAQQIDQFRNNSAYKNYQLTVRTMTASRSVTTDILTSLASERKPILKTEADPQLDAISRVIGVTPDTVSVKNANGDSVTMYRYASPMQIAKFRANYRLNNSQWYQEVAGDSAENLQRKSVILLAEISSQLYQTHLDNEKILGALAMMNLQSTDSAGLMLKTQINDVNAAISSFVSDAGASQAAANAPTSTSSASDTSGNTTTSSNTTTNNTATTQVSTDPNSYSTDPNSYNTDPNSYTPPPTTPAQ